MNQIILAFVTGLTTGGLSCMAVQGGLLVSSLGRQLEQDMLRSSGSKSGRRVTQPQLALPIALFLLAKLSAYTVLGFFLGWLGSKLTLSTNLQSILLIAIGIFMVGNALRMFNVHPIFRYFAIEPPKFITRYIRRTSKKTDIFTPLFLGALTIFIPCGVAQAMMAVALGTGSALTGAALMFAFTLGTSPVFFAAVYFTMQLGKRLEKWFMRFVAVVVLVLGMVSINSGLNLTGSPLAIQNIFQATQAGTETEAIYTAVDGTITLRAENYGYSPSRLYAPAGIPLVLNVVTDRTLSCSRAFVIPALRVQVLLPETGVIPIDIPAQPAGTVMQFTCSMGMYTGEIVFGQ